MQRLRGFSLLEVIIIIALLSLGFFPLMNALSQLTVGEKEVERFYLSADLARDKIEAIKATPFDNITNEAETAVAGFPGYTSIVSVDPSVVNRVDVTVTVKKDNLAVTLRTLLTNYD
ncbi:MAG: hypothetical protein NT099_09620 [Candidatus Saganbacteria bacterium]|nr:hypothetical protein [Candidatus Saganbacteria bacterium]